MFGREANPAVIGKFSDEAISPDGKMAAYIAGDDNALYVFDGSRPTKLDLSEVKVRNIDSLQAQGLAWSPLAVRIRVGQ